MVILLDKMPSKAIFTFGWSKERRSVLAANISFAAFRTSSWADLAGLGLGRRCDARVRYRPHEMPVGLGAY